MQREKYRPAAKFASFFYGQKFTAKCLLALSLFVSAPLFANEMCIQLCAPCMEKTNDSMCVQINALCSCQALIDSIQAAETARTEKVKALKETLKTNLSENCKKEPCSFKIKIKNDELKYFHKAKAPETIEKLAAEAQTPQTSTDSVQKSESLITLNAECQNFCGFCPAEKAQDSTCLRIENVCKCQAFAEQEARLVEKANADSLQKVEAFLKRTENLSLAADSICAFQKTVPDSTLHVTLRKSDMTILDIQTFKEPSTDTVPAASLVLPADTAKALKDSVQISANAPADSASSADSTRPTADENQKRFYLGASLHLGQIYDKSLLESKTFRNTSFTVGIDFAMRYYLYKHGSFQWGLGAAYQYNDYDLIIDDVFDGGAYYYNFILELPLELRLGFPAGKVFSPFFSLGLNVRKPFYSRLVWFLGGESIPDSFAEDRTSGFYAASDFETLEFIDFGVEIYRRISVEWQFLIASQSSYANDKSSPYQNWIDTWQIKLDFVF